MTDHLAAVIAAVYADAVRLCRKQENYRERIGDMDQAGIASVLGDDIATRAAAVSADPALLGLPDHAAALAEALRSLLAAYAEPDQQFCCNGHHCGCRGASIRDLAEHYGRAALAAYDAAPAWTPPEDRADGYRCLALCGDWLIAEWNARVGDWYLDGEHRFLPSEPTAFHALPGDA